MRFVRQMMHEDWRRLTPKCLCACITRKMVKRDMATPNVNIPPGWRIRMLTVKNRRAHRACHQNPRHLPLQLFIHRYTCRRVVPPNCINARTAPVSNKAKRKDARRRPALSTPRLRRMSHLSESREKAGAHSKKLFNNMIARTKHVDNPPP